MDTNISICSNTIVKNGKPFIGAVLRQALPYVNRAIVTISEKSDDGTLKILRELEKEFKPKVYIDFENVQAPRELTYVRQNQLKRVFEDWVWFLDDDDYWPNEKIEAMIKLMEEHNDNPEVDALTMCPFQVIDEKHYDLSWLGRFFTKFFKQQEGVHYRHPWPRDLIYKGDEVLYWKRNKKVLKVPPRFFHLSYLKGGSFRNEEWAKKFGHKVGKFAPFPEEEMDNVWKIYEIFNENAS